MEPASQSDISNNIHETSNDQSFLRKWLPGIFLLIVSALFLLFFSLWTSPFYVHWYGCDCSFFSMVGRGITQGLVPYRDFFDLKGPYFFFIEALGQFLHKDRLGVYLTQIPFLWVSLLLIVKLSRLYLSKGRTVFVVLVFLFGHISILWGGNTLEEYMLPLNLLVIFLTVKFLKVHSLKNDPVPGWLPFITGICFGIMLFAKVTVAAPIMGICAALGISLLAYRRYKVLFSFILFFLLGVFLAAVPVFIYFAYHGTLQTMLYCVFEFAYLRSVDFSDPFTIKWELKLTACFLGLFTAIFHIPLRPAKNSDRHDGKDPVDAVKNDMPEPEYAFKYGLRRFSRFVRRLYAGKEGTRPALPVELCLILVFMSLFSYILLHLGNPWIYYFMTTEPILVLATVLLLFLYQPLILFSSVREAVCLITLFIYIFYFGGSTMDTIQTFIYDKDNPYYEQYYQNAQDIALLIPEMERNSVYSLDIDMTFFEATQIMPCYRYQINLQFFIALNPAIQDELLQYFDETPPKWMVVSQTLDQYLPVLYDVLMEKYHCLYFNDAGCLYVLNETPG
ncbi:MAG: hypothetical protein K6G83_14925 [Lachnospiraceae bacterium]|nr:hypothetical protein [Lachnospiraceae bacterium]